MKLKSASTFSAALAMFLTVLGVFTARAGTITVVNLPTNNTDAATGITTNKHYVAAIDFGSAGSPPGNINGVPLYHFNPGGQVTLTNSTDTNFGGQFVLSCSNSSVAGFTGKLNGTSSGSQGSPNNQADGNTRLMLYDLMFVTAAAPSNTWLHQEYDNLTIGDQYSLRLYYRYWGNAAGDRLINIAFNGEGAWQSAPGNPIDEDAGGAHYIEYDFTAAATNVFCNITNLIANGSMMVYGVTLEDDSVPFAPFVTYPPKAITVGNPTVFAVSAIGTGALSYQWYVNSASNYSGATATVDGSGYSGSTTTNLSATTNLLSYYFVIISNNYGSVTSSIVRVNSTPTVVSLPAPVQVGSAVSYSVTAGGLLPLTYQWYYTVTNNYTSPTATVDGSGYSGSTTSNLLAATNLQRYYFVIISNAYGSVTSSVEAYNPRPIIVTQPVPFKSGSAVGFNVSVSGWPTLGYQWYYNNASNISGAAVLTDGGGVSGSQTASVTVTNLTDYYFVVVSNYYGAITSSVVELDNAPYVISAGLPIWISATNETNVIILFSDGLDATTATAVGNYSLDNGATVFSAKLGASNEVVLTTSLLNYATSYTLTVQNVEDYFGITMLPSSTNLSVGFYPAKLALWLRADTGVTTDSGGVNQWNDISGNGNNFTQTLGAPFEPQLATNSLGDTVVRFTATNETFMQASSSPSLALTNDITIIAVINFADLSTGTNGEIISKTGSGTGSSVSSIAAPYDYYVIDTNNGARCYRGDGTNSGGNFGQFTATGGPSVGTPHILVATEFGNTVTHFLDGSIDGSGILNNSFNENKSFDAGQPVSIGIRGDAINRLTGDISELIVAGSAISSYDVAALDTYFIAYHNLPITITTVNPTPTNFNYSLSGNQLTFSWPADHIGWGLQSNSVGLVASNSWFTIPGSTLTNQVTITNNPGQTNIYYRMSFSH